MAGRKPLRFRQGNNFQFYAARVAGALV